MTGPNAAARTAMGEPVVHPCIVGWLDFAGDPVRVTTAPYDVTFSGTGDVDLDGFTFEAGRPDIIELSDVMHGEQGSETVTVTLSGLAVIDADILAIIDDRSRWRTRDAVLWLMLYDANLQRVGNIWRFCTGTMATAPSRGEPGGTQSISITIEGYLNGMSQAPGRSYLDQPRYDAGDQSAAASIAIANGGTGAELVDTSGNWGGGSGGGRAGIGTTDYL